MIYQQEVREVNDFYERYKDRKIVYSKEVSQSIGLVQRDTSIKVGSHLIKGALISSTMESFVLMAELNETLRQELHNQNSSLIVHLKFISRETGKSILFTIHTKFLNINNQGQSRKDLFFIAMQIRRQIPNDLIRIFGIHHKAVETRLKNKKKRVESLLLVNDSKTDCIAEKISKNELVLFIEDITGISMNQKAIAILKILQTGEVMEIIGTVAKIDMDAKDNCYLHLNFEIDDQSPRFGYSVHVLKNLINS